jgi:hypothetical protein
MQNKMKPPGRERTGSFMQGYTAGQGWTAGPECHDIPFRDWHLTVSFDIDTDVLSTCGQDDHFTSCCSEITQGNQMESAKHLSTIHDPVQETGVWLCAGVQRQRSGWQSYEPPGWASHNQSDKISHIDIKDDSIDTDISHIIRIS